MVIRKRVDIIIMYHNEEMSHSFYLFSVLSCAAKICRFVNEGFDLKYPYNAVTCLGKRSAVQRN